jgi:hypothetical protein
LGRFYGGRAEQGDRTAAGGVLLTPYAFYARGEVETERPSAVEPRTTTAGSYGAGIRVLGSGADIVLRQTELTLEAARTANERPTDKDEWRFNLAAALRF